jgi:hypothetical protein|tara:strand:+ start:1416 stop:2378 length:963 start_codon:yes stop_codon:yes gene_type:complete
MNNVPLQKITLGNHGLISYQADPTQKYKWLLHESFDWFSKAREKYGPTWKYYDNDTDPITYEFDSLGFRSDYEIADLPDDWVLCSTECIGVGPGLHNRDLYHKLLEERMGMPFYNASTYGGRLENIPFNLLQLSKLWRTPPKHIVCLGSQNSTGISVGIPGVPVSVKNIDYIPAALKPESKEKELLFLYQSLGIAKWQHMLMLKTIIRLAETWDIPILWIDGTSDTEEGMSKESTYNTIDDSELEIIHQFIHGVGISLPSDPDQALKLMSDMVLKPMQDKEPPPGATLEEVSRDLLHPGADCHKALADKIEFELEGFWYS